MKQFLVAVLLGFVGLAVGCLVVYEAVSTWTNISSHWINSGLVLPVLGLTVGLALAEHGTPGRRGGLRSALVAAACPLGALGNYLAWLITAHVWLGDKVAPEQQDFFYQMLHPDVLPTFVRTTGPSSSGFQETFLMYIILGAVAGPALLWYGTRTKLWT